MKLIYSFLSSRTSKKIVLLSFLFLFPLLAFSQNCTINANADKTLCPGGDLALPPDQFYLLGSANSDSGSGFLQNPVWSQISGPAVQIVNPGLIQTLVKGAAPGNTYGFRLSAQCADGSTVFDDVLMIVSPLTLAKAGPDITYCQGTYALSANTVAAGETGLWTIQGNNNGGISISNPNSPTTAITVSGNSSGATTLRWTIQNSSFSCSSYDEVTISTLGGVQPVTAGADINLSNCFSSTQNVNLNGSFGGTTPGQQQGTWTVVSGPNVPVFNDLHDNDTNVNGLVQGTYVFRWTVAGTCANGTDDVTVVVPAPTADVTNVIGQRIYFCDGRTATFLKGTTPLYVNETVQWTQTAGPPAVIQNPASASTLVTGMTVAGVYSFLYTLTNSTTNCVTTAVHTVTLEQAMSISGGPNQTLGCSEFSVTLPVTATGNGQMKWQIVDGPLLNPTYTSYPTPLVNFSGSSLTINNLGISGTYIIRLIKEPSPGSQCETVYDDIGVIASAQPTNSSAGTTQILPCNVTTATLAGNIATRGRGSWSQVSGPSTVTFSNSNLSTTSISGLVNGRYFLRWTISGGAACDVTQSLSEIIVSSALPTTAQAGNDQSVCFGTPVQLQGNAISSSERGTWTVLPSVGVTFSDMNDPDSKVFGLAQNTTYTFTWTIANGCGNSSDTVAVTTNNTQGANADAGADQCLATGTATITLDATDPSPGNGLWEQTAGAAATITNPTLFNTTVTGVSDGDYEFKWTVSNTGCSSGEDSVAITIAPTITVAQAGADQRICGDATTVTGNTPASGETGLWEFVSGGDGPIITNPSSPTTTITGLTSGAWVYKWTISRGTCAVSSDAVQLNIDVPPSPAIAGVDQVVCNQTSTVLAATSPAIGEGIWSLINGPNSPVFSNSKSPASTLSGLIPGIYVLEWTTYTGINCPLNKDQITVKVTQAAAAGPDISTCLEGPLSLEGNNGSTGTWTYVSGGSGTPTITTTGDNSASVTGLVPGVYVFRYTIAAEGSCPQSSDDITVTINGQITTTPNAGADQNFCNAGPAAISLSASALDVGTTGKWTILSGPAGGSFSADTNPNTLFINPGYGTYVFNWTVSSGTCSKSDQVRIQNAAPPSPAIAGDDVVICGSVTDLTAIAPLIGTGKWAQFSGPTTAVFSSQISPTTTVSNLTQTAGVYVFSWTVTNGALCAPATDNVQVTVTADLTVPQAGPDQTICQSSAATLAANAITAGTGQWTQFSGPAAGSFSNAGLPNSNFTPNGAGTYVLRWRSTNLSCTLFDDMTLIVDPLPTVSIAGTPISVCQFQPVALNANVPTIGTGLWTQISGPSIVSFETPNAPTTAVFGTQAGVYVFAWTISSGSCLPSTSNVTVTINELPPLSNAGTDQVICNVSTATLNGNNPSTGNGIWTFVSNAGNTALITNPNQFNTTVTNISTGTTRLKWTISSGSCTAYSDEVNIEKTSDLTLAPLPSDSIICEGGTLTLTAVASGSVTPYSYQWQSSPNGSTGWANISGETNSSYITSGSLVIGDYYYRVNVSNSCTQITSSTAKLTVVQDPVLLLQPLANTICSGDTHTMTVNAIASNTAAGALAYQWQSSVNGTSGWASVSGGSGATTNTYITAALTSGLYFRVQVTQSASGCAVFSNPALVSVASITAQPASPPAVCNGGVVNLSITASLNGGSGNLTYQWQSNSGSGFVNETNATALLPNFTSSPLSSTKQFRCLVTSSTTGCVLTSNEVTAAVVIDPAITAQPAGGVICTGGTFNLTATGTGGTPGLNYQWYRSTDNNSFTLISGATLNTYITPVLTANTYYQVTVSALGNDCGLATSNSALVTVVPDPIVTQQPVGSTICSGATHTMTVIASGDLSGGAFIYQWQRSTNGTTGWVNTTGGSGATTASYTTGALTSTFYYRARIRQATVSSGCEVFSDAVPVFVASIATQPVAPAAICVGGTISVSLTASLNGGSGVLSYQWQGNSGSGFVNETNATATTANFTSDVLNTTTQFRCLVTSSTTNCTLTSNSVTATVVPDPAITVQPLGTTICSGGNHTLSVTASNGTPGVTYQWFNSLNNTSFALIAGATGATYATPVLTQTTYYRVEVSASGNGCNTITSGVATVTVLSDVAIITQPVLKTNICSGSNATLNVGASGGSGNYTYQWKSSTILAGPYTTIVGAVLPSYTTPNLTQNTYYQVVISDPTQGCDPVTSSIAAVIIPSIITQPVNPSTICVGGSVSVSAAASANNGSASFAYQWQSSANGTSGWSNVVGGTGATTANYTSGGLTATLYYRAVITSSNPGCTLVTNVVMATVIPDPTITIQPFGGNICEGGTFTMTSGATNGSGNFTYQWQKSLNGATGWANVTDGIGGNTISYTTGVVNADTFYRLQVTDSGIGCGVVNSNAALLHVFESPLISTQPVNGEVCIDQGHTFTVLAVGNIPSSPLLYQWQTAAVLAGPYTNVTNGSGGTTASYTTPNYGTAGKRYFRVIISQAQASCQTISNQVTLDVFGLAAAPVGLVTEQPSCTNDFGTISISDPDLGTGYEYSIDGTTFQTSNVFANLTPGVKEIYVRKTGLNSCVSAATSFTIFNKICAIAETFPSISGDLGGNTGVKTILDSDILNGAPVNPGDVTLTINSISNHLIFDPTTNTISVAPGTPADNYTLNYTICENANPLNCSTVTETIQTTTAGIEAIIDIVPNVLNGFVEHLAVINVLTNDRLASLPATTATVQISVLLPASPVDPVVLIVPVLNTVTGDVDVPAGTPRGVYEIEYQICDLAVIGNCDSAKIIIPVGTAEIDANDDSAGTINGHRGEVNVVNAIANDELNGIPITAANFDKIMITQNTPASPLYPGANVPVFSTVTGNVTVPAETPADTYYITYTICEKLNPSNCSDASIAIVVGAAPIIINDDFVNNVNGYEGAVNVINAYTNAVGADTFDSGVININLAGLLTPTILEPATPKSAGAPVPELIAASGRVSIPAGTPAGQYQIKYQICENLNPGNCDDAIITINVTAPAITANDDTVLGVNGYAGAVEVLNAYENDFLNGGALTLSTITTTIIAIPSVINGGPIPLFDAITGLVSVPAGTPAGEYKYVYKICENLNPGNCDDAIITVTVIAGPLDAENDATFAPVNGFVGNPTALNALDNDTLNGLPIIPSEVQINVLIPASPINGGLVPILNPVTGNVEVPAGTSAWTYLITYQLSEKLNLTNFDTAIITVEVSAPVIEANDDIKENVNGYVTTNNAINVLINDNLNGSATNITKVTISVDAAATSINLGPVPVLEPLTGFVSIPAGTPAGDYEIKYTICERINPTNCNNATVFISVIAAPIDAVDDPVSGINGFAGASNVINALTNDTLNGAAVIPSQVSISDIVPAIAINGGEIPVLNALTGNVNVPAGTTAGTYTIQYRLNENLNAANNDTATITIIVDTPIIVANNDSVSAINGYTGANNIVNAITNDRLNGIDIQLIQVNITALTTATPVDYVSGNPVPVLNTITGNVDVPAGTSAGTYVIHYRICEKLNPSNCSEADIVLNVAAATIDADNDFINNINGYTGASNVLNALTNDEFNAAPAGLLVVTIHSLNTTVPVTSTNGIAPILNVLTGNVDVPAGTSSGMYTILYEICERLNPLNCSQATIVIIVEQPLINAEDDMATDINGYVGQNNILNAFTDNDSYNGALITDLNFITPTIVNPATPINGGLVPTLDLATGFVSVPAGTSAGVYQIRYKICGKLNPANCDEAVINIVVIAPVVVANDDAIGDIIGYTGANNVLNAYSNDTLNGTAVVLTDINRTLITPASSINGTPVPILNLITGNVDVPAGTHEGEYKIVYKICDKLNPTNCDEAVITITVIPAPIDAVDDTPVTVFDGAVNTPNAVNVLDNDTMNGVLVIPSEVQIAILVPAVSINGGAVPVLAPATGIVSIPAGTTTGTYTITYRLMEKLNVTNADTAIVTIVVQAPIQAINDSASGVNGYGGAVNVLNAIANDVLNGVAVQLSQINISSISTATPADYLAGNPVPVLNITTGIVDVPAGTSGGTYTIHYGICEKLNLLNCSEADITITVSGPILANEDTAAGINGLDGASSVVNVLTNDVLDNKVPTLSQVKIKVISPADVISSPAVPLLDTATGLVNVPAGTSSGIYTIVYEICENLNPTNCAQAVIKITVVQPAIALVKSGVFSDTNGDGYAQPGELIQYTFLVTNTGTIDLNNVIVTDPKAVITGTPISTLAVGQVNATNYTGTYVLTQADINLGSVTNQALVTAQPVTGTAIQDLSDSDDPALTGKDDPTVTPVNQFKQLTLVKGGQLTGNGGVGSVINYTFFVKNTGNVVVNTIEITDPLIGTAKIPVTPNILLPGAIGTANASYIVTLNDVAAGEVVNTALVVGDAPDGTQVFDVSDSDDPTLGGDDDLTNIDLTMQPSIAIIKTATFNDENKNGYAETGETITYHFAITNTGNVPLVNIIVKDPKPGIVITGNPIILNKGETNTDNFVGTYTLTAADIDAEIVENQATVEALDPKQTIVTDTSDDDSNLEDNPTVLSLNACKVTIYNAVSPNGDEKNEIFKIDGIKCYSDSYVQIYDRWGVLVYDAYGYDNESVAFRGISEGRATINKQKRLPDGTYFYVITYKTFLNESVSKTGYLYLSGN